LTNFKPLVKKTKNDVVPLAAVIKINFNKLKACVVVAVKLTSKFNMLLIAL